MADSLKTRRQAVQIDDLTVRFGSFTALHRVTCDFHPGTATAVMGVNGSGKTTFLESIAGLQPITSGVIRGIPDTVAYVRQCLPNVWMPITVREVIAMGCYRKRGMLGRLRSSDRRAILETAERLSVEQLMNCSFSLLSGGQRQRVRIAQALVAHPSLLMLDEPITGLDMPSQACIFEVIEECVCNGLTVIVATHHLNEARHCNRVLLMANRLVGEGSPDEMLAPEKLSSVFGHVCRSDDGAEQHRGQSSAGPPCHRHDEREHDRSGPHHHHSRRRCHGHTHCGDDHEPLQ